MPKIDLTDEEQTAVAAARLAHAETGEDGFCPQPEINHKLISRYQKRTLDLQLGLSRDRFSAHFFRRT